MCPNSGPTDDDNTEKICGNHGECHFNETAECICFPGFYGEGCELTCPGTDSDKDPIVECNNHGNCVFDPEALEAVCECESGYSGEDCSLSCPGLIQVNGTQIPCNNHGDCVDGKCECFEGYYGEGCDQSCPGLIIAASTTLECSGHGSFNPSTLECECSSDAWDPVDCGCTNSTCGDHGHCVDQRCQCDEKLSC